MEKFVFLEDEATADVAFIAYGKTKSEIISNACLALTSTFTEIDLIEKKVVYKKEFHAEDLLGLTYDVLNFLIFLFDTEELIFNKFHIDFNTTDTSLMLTGYGEKYNKDKHVIKTQIKAVTFFGMNFDTEKLKVTLDL